MKTIHLIGRIAFGGFFLYSGIKHILKHKQMVQYVGSKNVPAPEISLDLATAALIVGGASILLGAQPKWGAASLTGFLAAVSPIMHDFWNEQDEQQRTNQMIHFMKNMALLGAALALMGMDEPWPLAVSNA